MQWFVCSTSSLEFSHTLYVSASMNPFTTMVSGLTSKRTVFMTNFVKLRHDIQNQGAMKDMVSRSSSACSNEFNRKICAKRECATNIRNVKTYFFVACSMSRPQSEYFRIYSLARMDPRNVSPAFKIEANCK
jgi:hypothetical protein